MIAVDCTVIADLYVGEDERRLSCERLLRSDPEWISSGLVQFEFGSVLRKYAKAGLLQEAQMREALLEAPKLLSGRFDEIDAQAVWDVSREYDVSYYDASYVWVAMSQGVKLYSRDGKLERKIPEYVFAMP